MITGSEIVTVTKVGANVTRGIKAVAAPSSSSWPNAHEALMELYVILDEWCLAARASNDVVAKAIRFKDRPNPPARFHFHGDGGSGSGSDGGIVNTGYGVTLFGVTSGGFIERTLKDASEVLAPPVPWSIRWRRSQRRAAGRKTLRSMMMIYCPDLLESFETATDSRAAWVLENRKKLVSRQRDPAVSADDLRATLEEMEITLASLQNVRANLLALITERYPLGT